MVEPHPFRVLTHRALTLLVPSIPGSRAWTRGSLLGSTPFRVTHFAQNAICRGEEHFPRI